MEQLCENEVGVNSEGSALSKEATIPFTKCVGQYHFSLNWYFEAVMLCDSLEIV